MAITKKNKRYKFEPSKLNIYNDGSTQSASISKQPLLMGMSTNGIIKISTGEIDWSKQPMLEINAIELAGSDLDGYNKIVDNGVMDFELYNIPSDLITGTKIQSI